MAKKLGMSVIAASLLATGGFAANNMTEAFQNATYSGEFTVFYQSMEKLKNNKDASLLSKDASSADVGMQLGLSTAELDGWTFNAKLYGVDTLGLENNLVSGVMVNTDAAVDGDADGALNQIWWGEMNFVKKVGGTTLVMGRQKINTPLCNSDTWNVHPNTFDAIVAVNGDIPNLTLVGAFVGNERTTVASSSAPYSAVYTEGGANDKTDGQYNTFMNGGAYAAAAIYSGIPNTPVKFFYYDVRNVANAIYADVSTGIGGFAVAGQYMTLKPKHALKAFLDGASLDSDATTAFGAKVSAKMAGLELMGAFSRVGDSGTLTAAKVSDGNTKTPLYTATIGGDADVAGAIDTTGMKVSVGSGLGIKGLSASANYATYKHGDKGMDDTSTSLDLIAKYQVTEHMKTFLAVSNYDHATGYFAGKPGEANNFLRAWARWTY